MKKTIIAATLLIGLSPGLIYFTHKTEARSGPGGANSRYMIQTTPTFSINDVSLVEGNTGTSNLVFTVTLTAPGSHPPASVRYATADGTPPTGAISPTDYASISGPLIFPAGAGNATMFISVPINGDADVEPDETFFVNLSNADGGTISDGQGLGAIINDDGAPLPALSISDASLVEGNAGTSLMIFTVTLTATGSWSGISVFYDTADRIPPSATEGSDYAAALGILDFTAGVGNTTRTISVTINGDTTVEPDETFFVSLNLESGATVTRRQGVGAIVNDDGAPPVITLSINDVSVTEGNTGTTNAVFTVSISAPSGSAVTVDYATTDGTANVADTDYVSSLGRVTFPPGDGSPKTIAVPIIGDARNEPDETFFVILGNSVNATIADGQGACIIVNDDSSSLPELSIVDNDTAVEGNPDPNAPNGGGGTVRLGVELSNRASSDMSVDYLVVNGSATVADNDYVNTSGTLSIPAGILRVFISIPIVADRKIEPDENFFVNLSNAVGATIRNGLAVCTIVTDDCAFSINPASQNIPAVRSRGSFVVTSEPDNRDCEWTALSNDPWIHVSKEQGRGSEQVFYDVDPAVRARTGAITVAGQTFTVNQDGTCPASAFAISPTAATAPPSGSSGSVTITAPANCAWSVTTNVPWIQLRNADGQGSKTIGYDVDINSTNSFRAGDIIINGEIQHPVYQDGDGCPIAFVCTFFPAACGDVSGETRSFRDKVLATTPRGRAYTHLYYQFSSEAVQIIMLNPMLILRSGELMARYMPVIQAMARGDQVTLSLADLDEIDGFLNSFAAKGSPELRETVKGLCEDLRDPHVHSEFNITVTDGPRRELPAEGSVGKIKQRTGLTALFGVVFGAVFLVRFGRTTTRGRRNGRRALLWLALVSMLAPYGQVAVAAPGAPGRPEPTAGLTRQVAGKPFISGVASSATRSAPSSRRFSAAIGAPAPITPDQIDETADRRLPFSTYFGGGDNEEGDSIAVDSAGNVYVAGFTSSLNFPQVNAAQPNFGGGQQDAFVVKLDPSGTRLLYSTYIGGAGQDNATGIAVDPAGNAFITGFTDSTDFPVKNALQPAKKGSFNAFVVKLDPAGVLLNSTLFGGSKSDYGSSIAVDTADNIYVAGIATSTDIPTINALQSTPGGLVDAFVAKIDSSGSGLVYSTYLGGTGIEGASSIAVDSSGNVYLTGLTSSLNLRVVNALQSTHGGGLFDAFVIKLNSSGAQMIYSTYLGGGGEDRVFRIAVDSAGGAYVTGDTDSTNFPTKNAAQQVIGGSSDAFAAKLSASGAQLVYSTYLGGSGIDGGTAIAVDAAGGAYVTGFTASKNFPTASPVQQASGGGYDGFIAKLGAAGGMDHSTYIGGGGVDSAFGVAVNSTAAYVMGVTDSTNFPTAAPFQATYGGGAADLFIARFHQGPVVTGATTDGKRLIVFGSGFDDGAKILVDGAKQKTANDSQNPEGVLIGKKAARGIEPGITVTLQVKNPDGSLSNEFRYRRP